MALDAPRVSIFMFCLDRHQLIARAVDSVLAQTYPHVEIVVQDGASTDGTLEILRAYGDRVKLVSEPDDGADDAFLRSMRRCTGDILGSCLSDERLEPDAVERAVRAFLERPEADAVTGDALRIGFLGNVLGRHTGSPFDLVRYMATEHTPYFVSSFFRRRALAGLGLLDEVSDRTGLEFRMWTELGIRGTVAYVPEVFGHYGVHSAQLSNNPRAVLRNLERRLDVLDGLFAPGAFLSGDGEDFETLRLCLRLRSYACFHNHGAMLSIPGIAEPAGAAAAETAERLVAHLRRTGDGPRALDPGATVRTLVAAGLPVGTPGAAPSDRIDLPPIEPALVRIVARRFEAAGRPDRARDCLRLGGVAGPHG
jgi:glycosyltransferase involved in cell wall biosynthesis